MTSSQTPVAAELAYREVKRQIISGELAGGQLLSEGKIAVDLGVSRTPVHEAFLRLATEQLLDLASRKGAIVRPMTPTEASDVLAMRQGIEVAAAGQVFAAGGPAEVFRTALAENLTRQRDLVEAGDVSGFVDADDDFHALMVQASGNQVAGHFYDHLRSRQQRLRNLYLRIDPANLQASFDDHQVLAACFIDGDDAGFNAAMVAHLNRYQGAL